MICLGLMFRGELSRYRFVGFCGFGFGVGFRFYACFVLIGFVIAVTWGVAGVGLFCVSCGLVSVAKIFGCCRLAWCLLPLDCEICAAWWLRFWLRVVGCGFVSLFVWMICCWVCCGLSRLILRILVCDDLGCGLGCCCVVGWDAGAQCLLLIVWFWVWAGWLIGLLMGASGCWFWVWMVVWIVFIWLAYFGWISFVMTGFLVGLIVYFFCQWVSWVPEFVVGVGVAGCCVRGFCLLFVIVFGGFSGLWV